MRVNANSLYLNPGFVGTSLSVTCYGCIHGAYSKSGRGSFVAMRTWYSYAPSELSHDVCVHACLLHAWSIQKVPMQSDGYLDAISQTG